jgi:hypothetical protein
MRTWKPIAATVISLALATGAARADADTDVVYGVLISNVTLAGGIVTAIGAGVASSDGGKTGWGGAAIGFGVANLALGTAMIVVAVEASPCPPSDGGFPGVCARGMAGGIGVTSIALGALDVALGTRALHHRHSRADVRVIRIRDARGEQTPGLAIGGRF